MRLNRQDYIKIIASGIVISLLIGLGTVFFQKGPKKDKHIIHRKSVIDDQISPLENQGLFVELNRIRHRGLLDELIKPLNWKWREKPMFYATVSSEGIEYSTKDIAALGAASENYFNTWDTMFMEQKNQFNPDEEKETSTVEIIIYEHVSKGLFGFRSEDVEREHITLTYNYRTGRWKGDDYFKDDDGYGHYLGESFEVWFYLHQIDYDKDKIPYWIEVNVLHTDPTVDDSKKDPDNDGIPTDWEWFWGYDPFTFDDHEHLDPDIDGLENIEEYKTRTWFANPYHQDIYAEVDNMQGRVLGNDRHMMWEESIQAVIERFAQHGISFFIDQGWPDTPYNGGGSVLPFYETTSQDSGILLQFYRHYFPDERKGIFHYVVIGNQGGFSHPTDENTVCTSHISVNNKHFLRPLVSPFMFPTPRAWRAHVAAMFMHEIGHTLGIFPWTVEGCDNHSSFVMFFTKDWREYKESWGNYYSVMNYFWVSANDWRKELIDYSDGSNINTGYDVNDWNSLYLPTFQTVSMCNEDKTASPPGYDLCEFEMTSMDRLNVSAQGWKYNNNLTKAFNQEVGDWSPISSVDVTFKVFERNNESDKSKYDLRVFGLAEVNPTRSEYVLIKEGWLDENGTVIFYSQDNVIKNMLDKVK